MTNTDNKLLSPVEKPKWGETPESHLGYKSKQERMDKRGLEDWEMVAAMETSDQPIPYWFFAIFVVLLIVAVGLTFPFWGNRPGYERSWFDWGIPAGVAWVLVTSAAIYYMVDYRHILADKRAAAAKAKEDAKDNEKT
ncbi:hypothetical protein MNBD_GAMMA16-2154 [hydrothermal vent metagenome]|uniref:Uncharacterized protein n=1 Tax=hydrothermal vent metagenome TaxID=652676 RepID=A0A3B0Z019_9ZZZZ